MNNHSVQPNFGIRLLGFLLALVLFGSAISAIAIADIRIVTTKENLTTIIRQALFERATAVRVTAAAGKTGSAAGLPRMIGYTPKLDEPKTSSDASQALVEWVYDALMEQYGEELELTLEEVEAFVEDSTLKDTIAELGASLISDAYTGENTTQLDEQTIRTLLEENAAVIEEHFGVEIAMEKVDELTQFIADSDYVAKIQAEGVGALLGTGSTGSSDDDKTSTDGGSSGSSSGSSVGNNEIINTETGELNLIALLQAFRDATSATALMIAAAVAVVCAVLLMILYRKWIWRAFGSIGRSLMMASVPYLLVTVPALWMKDLWDSLFSFSSSAGAALRTVVELTAPVCIATFAAGFVLAVVSLVLRIIAYRKSKTTPEQELSDALIAEVPAPQEEQPSQL